MATFRVSARQYGDAVEFEVDASEIKEALKAAKDEAKHIFDFNGIGTAPLVSVKEIIEK